MNEPIKLQISEYGDIPGAISRLEESTVGCPDVCILICEELLDHLLKSGYRKIGVTVKGRKMRVIEFYDSMGITYLNQSRQDLMNDIQTLDKVSEAAK